ncbi:MAG: polyribonucleotide nucleotidyltransferase [Limnochordia bacterium]|jgi:polyribonucleotide nucleotidyltransferase
MEKVFHLEMAGHPLSLEVNKYAKQANGSVLVRYGDTVVLVTATMSQEPRQGIDFFPLLVDYEEKMYSIGKIPGGFIRREGRPSENAVLSARMIDRVIRPLFPEGFRNDVQVVATILSVDKDKPPTIPAMFGASVALGVSDIPFDGPIAGVVVGLIDGEFILNPTVEEQAESEMELVVAGSKDAVIMVEAGAKEVSEETVLDGIAFGHAEIKKLVASQEEIIAEMGKEKLPIELYTVPEELEQQVRSHATPLIQGAIKNSDKLSREAATKEAKEAAHQHFQEQLEEEAYLEVAKDINYVLDQIIKDEVRRLVTEEGTRVDGRGLDEIRPISCEVGLLPRAHGSGLFTRGQTQALSVCTLGVKSDEQMIDDLQDEDTKRYLHHYNFPGYCVGEVRPMRSPGRREIGHGALAERALLPVIPSEEEFPYTIRVVSEILESNGSSSQASICGSSLCLMDAGVPIKKPVAGIAMGLVKYGEKFAILTDIQGLEDALGDMDFKVAGTRDGITALQMDIKISGVSREILTQALEQARKGRNFILDKMEEAIAAPREDISVYAPRIVKLTIPVDKIRDVIGPGGKTIRKIIEETGVTIDIEDDGQVYIASVDEEASRKAVHQVERLVKDVEVGEAYLGTVKRVTNFGAFVEILPGKEGLVHISKLDHKRVAKVEDVVNVGDEVMVKVIEIDSQGRINLSRKDLLPREEGESVPSEARSSGRRTNRK